MTTYNEGVVRVMEVGDGVDDALRVSDGEGVTDVLETVQRRRRYPVREVGQNAAQKLSDCLVGELALVEDGVVLAQFVVAASRPFRIQLVVMECMSRLSPTHITFEFLDCGIHHGLPTTVGTKNRIFFILPETVAGRRLIQIVLHLTRPPIGTLELKNVVLDEGGELFLKHCFKRR